MKRLISKESERKVILYHGTTSNFANQILINGLLPRAFTGNKNFPYDDYKRKGEPRHTNSVYLTNDIERARKFANNAVEKLGGFPLIIKVKVSERNLMWDEYALYKNYGDFDFGNKDYDKLKWQRKPKQELWEQSLLINDQCAHHGKINVDQIIGFLSSGKFINKENFKYVVKNYEENKIHKQLINENKAYRIKEYTIGIPELFNCMLSIVDRNIYIYNLEMKKIIDKNTKEAICLSIFEIIKQEIDELGVKILYSNDLKKLGFNPKTSVFSYIFGSFEVMNNQTIANTISENIKEIEVNYKLLNKIINGVATKKEFNFVYEYSIDFIGDLKYFCKNVLNYTRDQVIKKLKQIKEKYKDIYNQIDAEIEYIDYRKE